MAHARLKDHVYSVTDKLKQEECSLSKEDLWHRRYGHLRVKSLQQLARDNLVEDFNYSASKEISFCEACLKGKHQRTQFPSF